MNKENRDRRISVAAGQGKLERKSYMQNKIKWQSHRRMQLQKSRGPILRYHPGELHLVY